MAATKVSKIDGLILIKNYLRLFCTYFDLFCLLTVEGAVVMALISTETTALSTISTLNFTLIKCQVGRST